VGGAETGNVIVMRGIDFIVELEKTMIEVARSFLT